MSRKIDRGRVRPGAWAALGALAVALAAAGNAEAATTRAADGLTAPAGGVLAPDGRWWVADHNGGFCRIGLPAGGTLATLETGTCLGGALVDPPPRPGPDAPGTPAFHDPTPGAPNSGDELVYVPEGATGSDTVMRLQWNPATGLFSLRDSIRLIGGADLRPTIATLGVDGDLYVASGRSTAIQRISEPESATPAVSVVGNVDRALAMAAGQDAAGAVTLYFGEPAGITAMHPNAAAPAASQPTGIDLGVARPDAPFEAGALAYDPRARALYVGTASAAHAGSGIDKITRVGVGGGAETVATGFTDITGLSLGRGALAVFDGPVGDGKGTMSLVDDPRVLPFVGPLPTAAAQPVAGLAAPAPVPAARPRVGRITRLRVARRISQRRLRRSGLRLTMRVAEGTRAVRVRITRRGAGSRRRSTASYQRTVRRAGVISFTIRTRAVRRLRTGRYTVRVTPIGPNGAGASTATSLRISR
jgi:hypothetical protein